MLLKRLELTGFKSFATKTTVDFPSGITIIVGPNGCGKSNIFDAVRWVLGEQSAKSLRGNRMGDVIFAGTSNFKSLSYSQVTVVIDNQDRKIPVDFSEISVSRRLFATGESEYLLNKTPCRLKDIVELFMDTGIGTDAYSFMEQGRVDQIIRAKPRERRYIFEEAAGISRYKARKEEALRKLIRTEEDLLRLQDIIEEVKRNAASLKRQASKAERYKRLLAQKREIEKHLMVLRYKYIEQSSLSIEQEFLSVSNHHAELSARIGTLNAKNEEGRTESEALSQKLSDTQSQAFHVNSDIEKTRHHINLFEERIVSADETCVRLQEELEEEQSRAKNLEETFKKLGAESRESESNLAKIDKELEEKKNLFNNLKHSHQENLSNLESLRGEQSECLGEKIRLQNEIRYSEAMRERITAQIKKDSQVLEQKETRFSELEQNLVKRKISLGACDEEIEQLKKTHQFKNEAIKKAESELESTRVHNDNISKELHESQSRLKVIKEMIQNYEGFQQGVKAVMKASANGEVEGITGMPTASLTLPKEYEQAIESALGMNVQTIITSEVEKAEKAIRYLRDKKAGHALFLPRDLAWFENSNGRLRPILEEQGVVGLARDMIKGENPNKTLLDALLGDTVIVDKLSTAMRLVRAGKRTRYVTLDGECLETNGVISGGTVRKSSILSRQRLSRELSSRISKLRKECEDLMNKIMRARGDIDEHRGQYDNLVQSLHSKEVERASLIKEYEAAEEEYKESAQDIEALSCKINDQEIELAKFLDIRDKNNQTVEQLEKRIREIDQTIEQLLARIEKDKARVEEFDDIVSSLLLEQTKKREQTNALKERISMLESSLESCKNNIGSKQEELRELTNRKTEIIREIKDSEKKLQKLIDSKEDIDQKVTFCTQEHETLTLELKKLGQEIVVLQRELNEVQNAKHEIDLKRAQFTAQKENLSQQSEEKFGKSIQDVIQELGDINGDREELLSTLNVIKDKIDRIGPINAAAIEQYEEAIERYEFLNNQQKDLTEAKQSLQKTITHIDQTTTKLFNEAFEKIRANFIDAFRTLFNGGRADLLIVVDEENKDLEPGIEIVAQPPGKKLQNISLLSGGEKALTAIALLFSIFMFKPSPFCLMDEIDAALDDVNVGRFKKLVQKFAKNTQFIIVTHNKQTMSLADTIYGVTMEELGVSKLVSVKFENLEDSRLVG